MVDALSSRRGGSSSEACAQTSETSASVGTHTGGDSAATRGSSEDTAVADFPRSGIPRGVRRTT